MKKRQANPELLRIIAMTMIITMHLLIHGGVIDLAQKGTASYYIAWGLLGLCIPAINLYIIIPLSRVVIEGLLSTPLGKLGFLEELPWAYI